MSYAFAVAFVGLLLPGGHVAGRLGRRRALVIALTGFTAAGLLCAVSDVFPDSSRIPAIILGRVLQGGFGALVTAAALSMVATGFTEPKERIRAFGLYASASVCGPVLGLLATEPLGPGPMLGISMLLALVGIRVLPNDRPDRTGARFDLPDWW
ncbi:MFS transporter [Streptomyces sp. NPDC087538]|uniref:MFS transporter n=1 Tax=Streptomyces sp. NPDC087538 TaxID=3365797 RepID=UPI00382B9315